MKKINVKKTVLLAVCYALVVAVSIGATIAYMTARDAEVNVFTFGQVKIDQVELQRKTESSYSLGNDSDLEPFKNGKPLYPAVYDEIAWDDQWQEWESGGSSALFSDEVQNVVDKFVFVENEGKNDAYVRTWFAFEAGDLSFERFDEIMHLNVNDTHWEWSDWNKTPVEIDGVDYYIISAIYRGTDKVHTDGKLPAGETTRPSLLQFFFDKDTTMEESKSTGDEYTILVRTQAVQTAGLSSADEAFESSFGSEHPWN